MRIWPGTTARKFSRTFARLTAPSGHGWSTSITAPHPIQKAGCTRHFDPPRLDGILPQNCCSIRIAGAALSEGYPEALVLSPHDAAVLVDLLRIDRQIERLGDTDRAFYLDCRAGFGHVANQAFDARAVEADRSGLHHSMA